MTNVNLGRKVKNRFKVQKKQWTKWSNHARRVFNHVMLAMRPSRQPLLVHPKAAIMHTEHWHTIRWNSSWLAAEAANGEKQYTKIRVLKRKKKRGN